MIAPMLTKHCDAIAALHCERLGGLLTQLGPRATAAIYRGYLASPACVAFVDMDGGVLRGFVLGATRPDVMRKDALKANGGRILAWTGVAAAKRPRLLPWLIGKDAPFDATAAELTYIAARAPGGGVGSALLDAFAAAVPRFELSVEATNEGAIRFYEARSLRLVSTYEQFGTAYRRYRKE